MSARHRRSIRLRAHDYRGGLYFVTVCTRGRRQLFGEVSDGRMMLSDAGRIAHDEWLRTAKVRPDAVLDAFVVMPDHVHLLFGIVPDAAQPHGDDEPPGGVGPHADDEPPVGATRRVALSLSPDDRDLPMATRRVAPTGDIGIRTSGPVARSAGAIVGQYKSRVTKQIWAALGRETGAIWQRGFHDRVVRTDREADAVRRYIHDNPARWGPQAGRADGHRA